MTTKERIAIIEAGMSGLSAAIYLQHGEYQVAIFGKNLSGKLDVYTFDLGPTIVMWLQAYRELLTITGRGPEDYSPT